MSIIQIKTDEFGKLIHELCLETCRRHELELDFIYRCLSDIDRYEKSNDGNQNMGELASLKTLYGLQALFLIIITDGSIITSQMHNCKNRFQHLFYVRQLYLSTYEAYRTYNAQKVFLRGLVKDNYPALEVQLKEINMQEKAFSKAYKLENLKKVRNKVGGHIDEDFKSWYETLHSLNDGQGPHMSIAFVDLFKLIFELTVSLTTMERQRLDYRVVPKFGA
ncbi:hypothetical protein [Pedobacter paludis]|uniref:HEPN AbiU2-like domain-containing protein n=1 Tax=Pedobacter paludis TaxID=2203212 RepID=A0A317F765_9SPHI|nr:hypothetical protein [Pedobacter paludis]PWS33368.1 hypothetical protein DF947_01710 [Pedobacter paludis]